MSARKTRVLVVDDSVVARRLLGEVLGEDPEIEVVGTAASGPLALAKLKLVRPDIIVLDVEMPEMSGLELLPLVRQAQPDARVIMYSSLTARGAAATLDALALGASDYVTKPAGATNLAEGRARIKNELCAKIKALHAIALSATIEVRPVPGAPLRGPAARVAPTVRVAAVGQRVDIVAIGSSTGGPNALAEVIGAIDEAFPVPVVVVQHMPAVFTRLLAERLALRAGGRAAEAQDGELLKPGRIYVAPGDHHLAVAREGVQLVCRLNQGLPENFCRPAVDVLFRSLVPAYGGNVLAVVLTGMGQDGFRGCQDIKAAGGIVLAQDKATSVVWGMPGQVVKGGLADETLALGQIGPRLAARTASQRLAGRTPGGARGREAHGG